MDEELSIVIAALSARIAGLKSTSAKVRTLRLLERLQEGTRGNPNWILGSRMQGAGDDELPHLRTNP